MQTAQKKWLEWDGILIVLGGFFLVFPFLFVGMHYSNIYANLLFRGATVKGTITQVGVGYQGGRSSGYWYRIRYIYRVDGVAYESQNLRFTFNGPSKNRNLAWQQVSRYKVGQKVTVHYDKRFPGVSALELKFNKELWIIPVVSFLLGLLCIFIFRKCGFILTFKW